MNGALDAFKMYGKYQTKRLTCYTWVFCVLVYDIIRNVRKRKGLVEDIPGLDKYYDKI